ncbi:ABC transporter permease, partial [Candidatus Woesearchaeota archaeon CG_4_10_14_0_8_um_filter_47_5]
SIVSLGGSLQQEIGSQLGNLGGDLLTLRAGASRAQRFGGGPEMDFGGGSTTASKEEIVLDRTDVQTLKGVPDVKLIDTEISGRADVYYIAEKGSATVVGVDPATWSQITISKIADGRMLGPSDVNVVVIGGRLATGFFKNNLGVNQLVTINDRLFRIVGILDDQSTSVYMPITAAYDVLTDKEKGIYDTIIIKVKNEDVLDSSIEKITQKLMIARHVQANKLDFSISSNKERQQQRAQMTSSLTTFLTAIAAVALLVGAVGIANSMFTSVLEKTKEIGIMKAIGARNSDILSIFLLNAALIGFIGGLLGIICGILLSGFLPLLTGGSGSILSRFTSGGTIISIQTILIALGLSVLIGMLSGAIPAYQASRLKPVDALRYE